MWILMVVPPEVLQMAAQVLRFDPGLLDAYKYHAPFLMCWRFWLVSDGGDPPSDVYVAARKGVTMLVSFDDGFGPLVEREPVCLENAEAAIAYVRMFVRVTRPCVQVVESLADIPGLVEEAYRARCAMFAAQ